MVDGNYFSSKHNRCVIRNLVQPHRIHATSDVCFVCVECVDVMMYVHREKKHRYV